MKELIKEEASWILDRLSETRDPYWQGRIDALAWVLKQLPEEG